MPDPVIVPAADPAPVVQPVADPAPAPVIENRSAPTVTATVIFERCGRSADLGDTFARELIVRNEATPLTAIDFERAISDRLIEARALPPIDARAGRSGTENDGYRRAIEAAVILRADPNATVPEADAAAAREFRGMSMMEMARDYCTRTGIGLFGGNKLEIAGAPSVCAIARTQRATSRTLCLMQPASVSAPHTTSRRRPSARSSPAARCRTSRTRTSSA